MNINIASNIASVTRFLSDVHKKQIPFAMANTLNDLAFKARKPALPDAADKTFQGGATPFTKRGFFVKKAKKTNLVAEVFIGDKQMDYMKFQVKGGTRFPKRKALMISTDATKLNKYGNITPATYAKLINDSTKYFAGIPKGRTGAQYEGIWERYGRSRRNPGGQRIRMVARYVDKAQYRPLFPFGDTVKGVVFAQTGGVTDIFRKRLNQALRTAKPRK